MSTKQLCKAKNHILFLLAILTLCSCQNLPSKMREEADRQASVTLKAALTYSAVLTAAAPSKTPFPTQTQAPLQVAMIQHTNLPSSTGSATQQANAVHQTSAGQTDAAEWVLFSPVEYSTDQTDILYARFRNTGTSTWNNNYRLIYYAGDHGKAADNAPISQNVAPGEETIIEIPIMDNGSWKTCWQIQNNTGESFYEFCYNRGSGTTSASAQNNSGNSGGIVEPSDVYTPFTLRQGSVPSRNEGSGDAAELVSYNPINGYVFCAYDHTETWSISLKNTGTTSWNSAYSLHFYSGYNFMTSDVYPMSGETAPGDIYTFNLTFIVHEDNDIWHTCWYLADPSGNSITDFCYRYYTNSGECNIFGG